MMITDFTIITPCFNENITVITFLKNLENVLKNVPKKFTVIVVDDSSNDQTLNLLNSFLFESGNIALKILSLRFNLGHQGAIYQGLLYAAGNIDSDRFIIMDSDGEDDPEAILSLVEIPGYDIVNVVRGTRKEKFFFRFFYIIYRLVFKLITGVNLNYGNYCMISKKVLLMSVHTSFIHFAAYLSRQKVTTSYIVNNRKSRLHGRSKMTIVSLIHHAIKSFMEYAEELLTVFLKLFLGIGAIFLCLIGVVVYKKLFTNEAIPGWASTLSATLFNMELLCLGFFVTGILLLTMLSRRNSNPSGIYDEIRRSNDQ